jgi:hypothetical protein
MPEQRIYGGRGVRRTSGKSKFDSLADKGSPIVSPGFDVRVIKE